MNGAELYDYYASFPNQEDIKFSRWNPELRNANFDWGELASQAGFTQDYNISLSGGNEKMSSYFSLGYYSEEGTVKGYKYDRYSFRYRSNYKPFSWLTIKPNISGSMKIRMIPNMIILLNIQCSLGIAHMMKTATWYPTVIADGWTALT